MKVALLFSGFLRDCSLTNRSWLENLVWPLNADIFVSTWDVKNISRPSPKEKEETHKIEMCDKEGFIKLYGKTIKSFLMLPYESSQKKFVNFELIERPFDVYKTSCRAMIHGLDWQERLRSIWWLISKGIESIRMHENLHGFKYDAIIKSRTDFQFVDRQISTKILQIEEKTLYVSGCGHADDIVFSSWNKLSDWYFLGDGYVAEQLMFFWEEIGELYEKHNVDCSNAEEMFYAYTIKKGLRHRKLTIPVFKAK